MSPGDDNKSLGSNDYLTVDASINAINREIPILLREKIVNLKQFMIIRTLKIVFSNRFDSILEIILVLI